jgi:hypothetical protein
MLEDSNFHIQCITVYYAHKPLNISECVSKIKRFGRLNVSIRSEGYCKLLLTCRLLMCVSSAACSGSVQLLSVDLLSHFHTARYKLTTYATYVQRNMLANSRNHCCSGKATMVCVCRRATYHCQRDKNNE